MRKNKKIILCDTPKGVDLISSAGGVNIPAVLLIRLHLQIEARRWEDGWKKGKRWAQGKMIFGGAPLSTSDAITGQALNFANFPSSIPVSLFLSFALPFLVPQTRRFCFVGPSILAEKTDVLPFPNYGFFCSFAG